jgi:diguanylate cyclase (GGDEF)-like protein
MRRLLLWLGSRGVAATNGLAMLLLLLISGIDYLTPPQITTSVFYVAPIALAAWFGGRRSGLVMAAAATVAWLVKDIGRGVPYAELWILSWNTAARLSMFAIIALLITEVRIRLQREEQLARIDSLTGLFNARAFQTELSLELARTGRSGQPLSFAYLDLDNFKPVNDEHGHAEGDRALAEVAEVLRTELRRSDVVGRIGGDEFAIILPATGAHDARAVVTKLQLCIRERMSRHGWAITASIGLITCAAPPSDGEALMRAADRLMYRVKGSGKNTFAHDVWPAPGSFRR